MKNSKLWMVAISLLIGLHVLAQTPNQIDPQNAAAMMENVQNMQKDMARLKALKPLTNEQLKAWLPETLGELKRIRFSVGDGGTGMVAITGRYNATDEPEYLNTDDMRDVVNTKNKTFVIEVMDGAGSGADMFSSMVMLNSMNFESEDEYKQVKRVNVNGISAQQTHHKQSNKTELQFFHKDRFGITVTATYMDPDETWAYMEIFDLEDLPPKD